MIIYALWGPCCAVFMGPRSFAGMCVVFRVVFVKVGCFLFAVSGCTQDTLDLVIDAYATESRRLSAKATKDDGQRSPDWPVAE